MYDPVSDLPVKSKRNRRRGSWLPWRRERERRVGSAALSLFFHLALLFLLASFNFAPGSGLIGLGQLGLGEATLRLEAERATDVDARDLLKDIKIAPLPVVQRQQKAPQIPKLRSLGPLTSNSRRLENVAYRFRVPGGVGGLAGDFGSMIGRLRKSGLDVVLVIDSTGSMQHVIDELKSNMAALVENLQRLVPTARIGAVAFRDRGDEYVVRWSDLSFHGNKVNGFLDQLRAEGGGDWEEGVLDALDTAVNDLSWRKRSKKVIVLVGSSPPHEADKAALFKLVEDFRDRGGIVSTIDLTTRLHREFERRIQLSLHGREPTKFSPKPSFYREVTESYRRIADAGGGEMAGVDWNKRLTEQILVFAFGSRWQTQLAGALAKK